MEQNIVPSQRNHLDSVTADEKKTIGCLVSITAMMVRPIDERPRRIQPPLYLTGKRVTAFTEFSGRVFAADASIRANPDQSIRDEYIRWLDIAFAAGR